MRVEKRSSLVPNSFDIVPGNPGNQEAQVRQQEAMVEAQQLSAMLPLQAASQAYLELACLLALGSGGAVPLKLRKMCNS